MYESPKTLEETCLDVICDNLLVYIEPIVKQKDNHWWNTKETKNSIYDDNLTRYTFKDNDLFLINLISEKLWRKMLEKRLLSDCTVTIFSEQHTKLRSVKITNCKMTESGLRMLKQHKIREFDCIELRDVSIGNVLDCLNDWSLKNMTHVNFSKCSFIDPSGHSFMVRITQLKNLRSLNLSYTELNQHCFEMICEDLWQLEKLDISGSLVKDLRPLGCFRIADSLKSLGISDLPLLKNVVDTLMQLNNLLHLDICLFNEKIDNLNMVEYVCPVTELLEKHDILPKLKSLDISGWKDYIPQNVLYYFIEQHAKLEYLGIVLNIVTFDPIFSDSSLVEYPKHLTIAGLGNEQQIKVTLQKYWDKPNYVQKALYHLFQLTNGFQDPRPEMFNLVLPVMAAHSSKFGVQMAATACLYNLTKGELSKHIHPSALSKGVNLTLNAMAHFPEEFQLQKNSLLTLCSDRILQEVNFNRFRCARLVLDTLCAFEDTNMNRMAVAICSILAAKISTEETSELGARPQYMRKLLAMVQNRVDNRVSDITLKFTLSALWNLTDESPATCTVFLELDGAYLFLNVLKTFKDDSAIETKVLGLLNNIAEVGKLRHSLMLNALIEELFTLVKSENIDVSYFAAGIVAHLASDGAQSWTVTSHSRSKMLEELESAITQWKVPDNEMVAYRSFRPFFPLLEIEMDFQVQLWAVWAIHHVCTKNPKRYCMMLREEKGDILLNNLILYNESHPDIRQISTLILDTLKEAVN